MSKPSKLRKMPQGSNEESKWRKNLKMNTASNRYPREIVLKKFLPTDSLPIPVPDSVLPLFLPISEPPSAHPSGFSHPLGEIITARRPHHEKKQATDGSESPEKPRPEERLPKSTKIESKPANKEPIVENSEEKPEKMSESPQKKSSHGKKEAEVEQKVEKKFILPSYNRNFMLELANKGNPFARAMIQTGVSGEDKEKVYFPLGLKPYEKVWFYKDPNATIQGPFSCIEMFNWSSRNCFPEDLEISFGSNPFIPMNAFFTLRKSASENVIKPAAKVETAVKQKNAWVDNEKFLSNLRKPIGLNQQG